MNGAEAPNQWNKQDEYKQKDMKHGEVTLYDDIGPKFAKQFEWKWIDL
jgi:hypothetical protein